MEEEFAIFIIKSYEFRKNRHKIVTILKIKLIFFLKEINSCDKILFMETVTDQFFSKHEFRINQVIANIYLALCFLPVTVCILSYAGIYHFPREQSVIGLFVSLLIYSVLFLLRSYTEYQSVYKYIALLGMQFIVFLYSMDVNIQITILYMLVPIVSVLYYIPKLTFYSCIIAFVSMVAGTCISAEQAVEIFRIC